MSEHHFPATMIPTGQRLALAVEYDGSAFFGWQSQRRPNVPSVQEALEAALAKVADQSITIHCAGRTDAGVHASHQIIHFDSPCDRPLKAWVLGGNTHLPDDVVIKWAKPVSADFHARFSATARRYRYLICNSRVRPALNFRGLTWEGNPLNHEAMHEAAQCLLGELDFSSFRAAGCQSNTPMRNVHFIEVTRRSDLVVIDIQANAFLHHMVRNIVGTLLVIGRGEKPAGWVEAVLNSKDRRVADVTAKPNGLYLVDVIYPQSFALPSHVPGPLYCQ